MNALVASRVAERLKAWSRRKLENFQKISEMIRFDSEYQVNHPKYKFSHLYWKSQTTSRQTFHKRTYFNFVFVNNPLSKIVFCTMNFEGRGFVLFSNKFTTDD